MEVSVPTAAACPRTESRRPMTALVKPLVATTTVPAWTAMVCGADRRLAQISALRSLPVGGLVPRGGSVGSLVAVGTSFAFRVTVRLIAWTVESSLGSAHGSCAPALGAATTAAEISATTNPEYCALAGDRGLRTTKSPHRD